MIVDRSDKRVDLLEHDILQQRHLASIENLPHESASPLMLFVVTVNGSAFYCMVSHLERSRHDMTIFDNRQTGERFACKNRPRMATIGESREKRFSSSRDRKQSRVIILYELRVHSRVLYKSRCSRVDGFENIHGIEG